MAKNKGVMKGLTDDAVEKAEHEAYVHAMGIELLKMRLREDKQRQMEVEKLKGEIISEKVTSR